MRETTGALRIEDTFYGLGVGLELNQNWRVGVSVYNARRLLEGETTFGLFGGNQFSYVVRTRDTDFGINLGTHVSFGERWSAAFTWRSRLEFDETGTRTIRDSGQDLEGVFELSNVLPSALTLGLAFKASERLTIAADVASVHYSELIDKARSDPQAFIFPFFSEGELGLKGRDSIDVRLGAEFVLRRTEARTWLVRGGGSRQGNSALRARNQSDPFFNALFFLEDARYNAWNLGLGTVGDRFGFDLAFEKSSLKSELVLSSVYYF